MAKRTEKGNGIKLVDMCNRYNKSIMNTMSTPKKEKGEISSMDKWGWRDTGADRLYNDKCKTKTG